MSTERCAQESISREAGSGFIRVYEKSLGALTTDAAGKLDILWHDGDTASVNGAQVGVLEETNKVRLRSLLQRKDGRALEAQVGLEVLCDLADEALEGKLADQQLS